jgi:hypothetical protein
MANSHQLFQHYNSAIKLSDADRSKLMLNRDSLRIRMKENFKKIPAEQRRYLEMYFQTQGSFIMDTIIIKGSNPEKKDLNLKFFMRGL